MTECPTVREMVCKQIETQGLAMSKQITSGGLFSNPTYDNRTVYTLEDMDKLTHEGFLINEGIGIFLFNAIMNESDE
jgi:hypothetical protein